MNILALLLAGGVAYGIYTIIDASSVSNAGDKLISDIDGLKIKGWESGKIPIELTLRHSNPTGRNLDVEFMFLDITIDGKSFGSIRQDSSNNVNKDPLFVISKNSTSYQTVRSEVPLFGAAASTALLIANGKPPKEARIKGPMKVGGFVTEYDKVVPITIPFLN